MAKYLSCGKWSKNYIYILLSVICLLLFKSFFGYTFDGESNYEVNIFNNEKYEENFLIHQIFLYLFCIVLSAAIFAIQNKENKKPQSQNQKKREINFNQFSLNAISIGNDISLISEKKFKSDKPKYSTIYVVKIIFIYILLEQIHIIFTKYFIHMDFWMIQLYILSFMNFKLLKIEIYKHQKLAFLINGISVFLKIATVILTFIEGEERKALYVKYWWTIFFAIVIYVLYSFLLSYIFINIKELMDLKFISLHVILFFYGIIGFLFCSFFCTITTFISFKNIQEDYLFKVNDNNNRVYIDNFKIYFYDNLYEKNITDIEIEDETLTCFFGSFFFSIYKLLLFKIFQCLTPLHKVFSYPLYYFLQKILFLFACIKKIFTEEKNNYLISKLILDLFSDFFSIIGYLIYLEIIEINFCGFNYNIGRNIILRGKRDSYLYDANYGFLGEEEVTDSDNENTNTNSTLTDMYD